MATLESLPGDQRAVLQLVLGRGRSYNEIARLLSIDPSAVRERALAALDALGPQTRVGEQSRAQICDYLLSQLPADQLDEVRDRLARSAGDRAWARVLSSELASLASAPLPDIPLETSAQRAAQQPRSEPPSEPVSPAPAAADDAAGDARSLTGRRRAAAPLPDSEPSVADEPAKQRRGRRGRRARAPSPTAVSGSSSSSSGPRSSRIGGLIIIAVGVLVVVVLLVLLLKSGGSSHPASSSTTTVASTPAAASTTSATTTATTAGASGTGTSTAAKVVAQINLTPAATGSKAAGIAEVLKEGSTNGIAIVAQNMTANTTEPPNAYAVWLYNSPHDATILGFVNPGVGATGKLSTAGPLPSNASHFKQLIVTLETSADPKTPGQIVLQGTFSGVA